MMGHSKKAENRSDCSVADITISLGRLAPVPFSTNCFSRPNNISCDTSTIWSVSKMMANRIQGADMCLVEDDGFVRCQRLVGQALTQHASVCHVHNVCCVVSAVVEAHAVPDTLALARSDSISQVGKTNNSIGIVKATNRAALATKLLSHTLCC